MTRRFIAVALLVSAAAATSAAPSQQVGQLERQQAVVKSLLDLAVKEKMEAKVDQLSELFRQLQLGKLLSPQRQQAIFREVENRLKPVPIVGNSLSPQLTQEAVAQYRALTAAQKDMLLDRAASVAQIEIAVGNAFLARGTGFVVGKDLIATNCHVLALISSRAADGTWTLRPGVRAHFAPSPVHDSTREFLVTEIVALPSTPGLDVVILRVSTTSVEGAQPLPKPLKFRAARLDGSWPADTGFTISLVGYPRISTSSDINYAELRKRGTFGKVFSPGAVMEVSTDQSIELLDHVASTTDGSSGSPLFSTDTFEVVGVHNCCTAAGSPSASQMPCAQILKAATARNHAVSAFTIVSSKELAGFIQF